MKANLSTTAKGNLMWGAVQEVGSNDHDAVQLELWFVY